VAKYKPFILNRIRPFLQSNVHLRRQEVEADAIRITWEASQRFKPELGYDFSTYLRHLLPNRLYDAYGLRSKDEIEPDILKTESVRFVGRERRSIGAGYRRVGGRRSNARQRAWISGGSP
jgi:hypothetical protein